jgi:2-methylcitrate dehydratase PrpD
MTKTLAQTFGDFATTIEDKAIPDTVRDAALWHIVDAIGVCIAGASPNEDSGKAFRRAAAKWRTGEGASILGIGVRARPELAALANGSLAQALEMDDKHGSSLARPGSTVVPAVIAYAEEHDLSVADMITACVVGYETMIRLGFVGGDRFLERGYHTSSLIGSFGVAAAIGRLAGATSDQIVDAMGICGTFASGIQESTRTGSTSKILHGGWGAHAGMLAIDLAQAGITGPDSVFEGKFGFFQTHLTPVKGELDFATAGAGLGSRWYLPETAFKPYPCCQLLHAFIEAGKRLLVEFDAAGISIDQITDIHCKLAEPGLTLVTEPKERKKRPQTPHEARFSLPYGVAATLVHGDVGLDTFRADRLGETRVLDLAAKVRASVDPDSDYPAHCPAILEIEAGGRSFRSHVPHHPGCPEAPMSRDDVLDKFARNSSWLFGAAARDVAKQLGAARPEQSVRKLLEGLSDAGIKVLASANA